MGSTAWAKVGSWEGAHFIPIFLTLGEVLISFLPLLGGQPPPPRSKATGQCAVRAPVLQTGAPQPFSWDTASGDEGTWNQAVFTCSQPSGRDKSSRASSTLGSQGPFPDRSGKASRRTRHEMGL